MRLSDTMSPDLPTGHGLQGTPERSTSRTPGPGGAHDRNEDQIPDHADGTSGHELR
jgi:hypothetical protein